MSQTPNKEAVEAWKQYQDRTNSDPSNYQVGDHEETYFIEGWEQCSSRAATPSNELREAAELALTALRQLDMNPMNCTAYIRALEEALGQTEPKKPYFRPCHNFGRVQLASFGYCQKCGQGFKQKTTSEPTESELQLLKVVQSLYLKHHCGYDDEGWEKLSEDMHDALCNAMGDQTFCEWMDEERSKR